MPSEEAPTYHRIRLRQTLSYVFEHLELDYAKWILTLSGRLASRLILVMMSKRGKLRSATWGLKSAVNDKLSDAYVAKLLAERFALDHRYFETDVSEDKPIEKTLRRYLLTGEGRCKPKRLWSITPIVAASTPPPATSKC